jgi:hypothetical protein
MSSFSFNENTEYPLEAAFFEFCPTEFFDNGIHVLFPQVFVSFPLFRCYCHRRLFSQLISYSLVVCSIINDLINQGVEELEKDLLQYVSEDERNLVQDCCTKVLNKYQQTFNKNLDKVFYGTPILTLYTSDA